MEVSIVLSILKLNLTFDDIMKEVSNGVVGKDSCRVR
jgi:hypothetical protein